MVKIIGRCLVCNAIHHREVNNPNDWINPVSVWVQCGNEIHGVTWELEKKEEPKHP